MNDRDKRAQKIEQNQFFNKTLSSETFCYHFSWHFCKNFTFFLKQILGTSFQQTKHVEILKWNNKRNYLQAR